MCSRTEETILCHSILVKTYKICSSRDGGAMDFDTCICMATAWFSFGSCPMLRTKPQTYVDIFPILVPMLYIKHELIYHPAAVQPSPLGWIWEQDPLLSWFSWLRWQKTLSLWPDSAASLRWVSSVWDLMSARVGAMGREEEETCAGARGEAVGPLSVWHWCTV